MLKSRILTFIAEVKLLFLELFDSTVYFNRSPELNIRVDFEYKIFGLAGFVWRFFISLTVIGIVSAFFVQRMLKKTFVRRIISNSGQC